MPLKVWPQIPLLSDLTHFNLLAWKSMNIKSEISVTEFKLRGAVRREIKITERYRDDIAKARADRESLEARLNWLRALDKQGLKEIA